MLRTLSQSLIIFGVITFGVFLTSSFADAQQFQLYSADDIIVDTTPKIPGPNQQVKLKLTSYSFNLNNYYIAWFKNGEQVSADYGNREFSFQTGNSGEITDVLAVIEFENQVFRKELRFAPSEVNLLWEVIDGYTPPFYKGKSLPVAQSKIKVTAIPETLLIEPTDAPNLVYYWDRNYNRQSQDSGFGKQSFEFTADPLSVIEKITVTSNDRRENSFAKNTLDIPTTKYTPKILFYGINDDGRLLRKRALNTNNVIDGDTARFSFHPLYMSSVQPNFVDLFVNWSINNQPQPPQDFEKQNELYITSGGEAGAISVNVGLEGIEKLLQKKQQGFELIFSPKKISE
jgi:hypothetical protein